MLQLESACVQMQWHVLVCMGISPDAVIYACVSKACGIVQDVAMGSQIHDDSVCQGIVMCCSQRFKDNCGTAVLWSGLQAVPISTTVLSLECGQQQDIGE